MKKTLAGILTAAMIFAVSTGCKNPLYMPSAPTKTHTPDLTATAIATMWTKTCTSTRTQTMTHTQTATHTRTVTHSSTFTITSTHTNTGTFTHSPTITCTHTISATFTVSPTFTATPTLHVVIIFSSNEGGTYHIVGAGEGGAMPVDLTGNTANDKSPMFSPDGTKIAFIQEWAPAPDIYIIGAAGQDQTNITKSSAYYGMMAWSPDSSKVAYCRNGAGVYTAGLSANPVYLANGWAPSWSPDNHKIAYFAQPGGQNDIFTMNADGTGNTRLTYTGMCTFPVWSPDGSKIAYYSSGGICTMNADGTNTALVVGAGNLFGMVPASWSPDGSRIMFLVNIGMTEIFTVNADGTNPRNLTDHPAQDTNPVWSRDGSRIAFASDRDGDFEIYVMNSDGSNLQKWTDNVYSDTNPSWK